MNQIKFMKKIQSLIVITFLFLTVSCQANTKQMEQNSSKTVEPKQPVLENKNVAVNLPVTSPLPSAKPTNAAIKPTLIKVKNAKIRLGYGKKSAVVDLDETSSVTLGGESNHRFKVIFTNVKTDKIYYLFEVQSGAAISDPNAPCGGDAPQTLVWLKADLNLKIEEAKSEVFNSCAYNGGRYLQGKVKITSNTLNIVFQQQLKKTEINYNNAMPENGFDVKELK